MGAKPKAEKAPRRTKKADSQQEQSARFIKAARESGVDESGQAFDGAMRRLATFKSLGRPNQKPVVSRGRRSKDQ
jgi:hypothetical protein